MTWPAEYASATSPLMSEAVPPYLAMYSCTITWLSAFGKPPYQVFGTMIPSALLVPTWVEEGLALVRAGRGDDHLRVEPQAA